MTSENTFARALRDQSFLITAEYLAGTRTDTAAVEDSIRMFDSRIVAINAADNAHGASLSSLAASVIIIRAGKNPIFQVITRDRNRIALQSDLLGASSLGIEAVLILSGWHQILVGYPESANVYDIDSVQFIDTVRKMRDLKILMNDEKIEGEFPMVIGAAANPNLKPIELNMLKIAKKVRAGADFIQTQAVFDTVSFVQWLEVAREEGITEKAAVLAGIMLLSSAEEAERLKQTYSELDIPDRIIERLHKAGSHEAQKKEGLAICAEIIREIRSLEGVRGIHLLTGGKEKTIPDLLSAAGL